MALLLDHVKLATFAVYNCTLQHNENVRLCLILDYDCCFAWVCYLSCHYYCVSFDKYCTAFHCGGLNCKDATFVSMLLVIYVVAENLKTFMCNVLKCITDAFDAPGKKHKTRLANVLMQLRKCVAHPYLFEGTYAANLLGVQWFFVYRLCYFPNILPMLLASNFCGTQIAQHCTCSIL